MTCQDIDRVDALIKEFGIYRFLYAVHLLLKVRSQQVSLSEGVLENKDMLSLSKSIDRLAKGVKGKTWAEKKESKHE